MRDDEVWFANIPVVVKQDVDVDGAVMIDAPRRLLFSSEAPFNFLCASQNLARQQIRFAAYHRIQELVFRCEAPRLRFN